MKIITPGYVYEVDNFDQKDVEGQHISFIHKEPTSEADPTLVTIVDGTTNEEVLSVLIDRLDFLYNKLPDNFTMEAIANLNKARQQLEARTEDRKKRSVEGTHKE